MGSITGPTDHFFTSHKEYIFVSAFAKSCVHKNMFCMRTRQGICQFVYTRNEHVVCACGRSFVRWFHPPTPGLLPDTSPRLPPRPPCGHWLPPGLPHHRLLPDPVRPVEDLPGSQPCCLCHRAPPGTDSCGLDPILNPQTKRYFSPTRCSWLWLTTRAWWMVRCWGAHHRGQTGSNQKNFRQGKTIWVISPSEIVAHSCFLSPFRDLLLHHIV